MINNIKYILLTVCSAILLPLIGYSQTIVNEKEVVTPDTAEFRAIFSIYDRLIESSSTGSEIIINQDPKVEELLRQHFHKGADKKFAGWRIRIFRENSQSARDRVNYIVNSLKNTYPGIPVYTTYEAPTWYVSVGDFRTRDEAEKMKRELKITYPGASLIRESINFPPL